MYIYIYDICIKLCVIMYVYLYIYAHTILHNIYSISLLYQYLFHVYPPPSGQAPCPRSLAARRIPSRAGPAEVQSEATLDVYMFLKSRKENDREYEMI